MTLTIVNIYRTNGKLWAEDVFDNFHDAEQDIRDMHGGKHTYVKTLTPTGECDLFDDAMAEDEAYQQSLRNESFFEQRRDA